MNGKAFEEHPLPPLVSSAPSTQPKLCQPRRGGNNQERQQSLRLLDFLHHLNLCAMRTSPAKNPSEGF